MSRQLYSISLLTERDVVLARQRAREVAAALGFDHQDQIRIATSTSEIARNAFRYARNGKVDFGITAELPARLTIRISDSGGGIPHLQDVLDGIYVSSTGLGKGILGTQRLMDEFEIESSPRGTTVRMAKALPLRAPAITDSSFTLLQQQLKKTAPENAYHEVERQNQELLRTLAELRSRQEELTLLNRELEDTNRGVVALYAELEERADFLRRASDLKSSFLSNMSHEFRTPLNSVVSLSRMLLEDEEDNHLNPEQVKQIQFILRSALDLTEMVNDLLDIAKVEAGKVILRPKLFEADDLFSALRGMLKPLIAGNSSLDLVFESPVDMPTFFTDEGKVSQILRNLLSNAIKYTPHGEVRVSAHSNGEEVIFKVQDTGIGILPEDLNRVFEEFVQIDNELQSRFKGTGLGLPLVRKLVTLLGGSIEVQSEYGKGSTFVVRLPVVLAGETRPDALPSVDARTGGIPVLAIEDNEETAFLYSTYLRDTEFRLTHAATEEQARMALQRMPISAIVFDIWLNGAEAWDLLREIKQNPKTRDIPLMIISVMDSSRLSEAKLADAMLVKPADPDEFVTALRDITRSGTSKRVLLVDDNEVSRYVLRQHLANFDLELLEARGGVEAVALAKGSRPDLIILDLLMPDMSGFQVVNELRSSVETSQIPIVVHTSKPLDTGEEQELQARGVHAVLEKSPLTYTAESSKVREILKSMGFSQAARSGGACD